MSLQFNKATTEDEIDAILDKPPCMMILNHSSWSILEAITKANKDVMLQQLILEEVIIRREAYLKAFRRGMSVLEITDKLQEYSHLLRPLQGHAYDMFMEFVARIEGR